MIARSTPSGAPAGSDDDLRRKVKVLPAMEWEEIGANWNRFRGEIRRHWRKLTDSDLDIVAGRRMRLVGKLQESYGIPRREAEQEVQKFCRSR